MPVTIGQASFTEAAVASAAACDIGATDPWVTEITGTTTITSFSNMTNKIRFVRFSGALLLTHNATSLIIPGGASVTTAAGDTCIVRGDASGNCRIHDYQRASGKPLVAINLASSEVTGILPYANGGNSAGAWTSYSPTISAASGLTSASATGAFRLIDPKTIQIRVEGVITTNGPGVVVVTVTLPAPAKASVEQSLSGHIKTTKIALSALIDASDDATLRFYKADGSYPGGDGVTLVGGGVYELA